MKALSGVERVWSGAPAQERKEPPVPPSRHLAPGGRIGMVMPAASGDGADVRRPSDEAAGARRAPSPSPSSPRSPSMPPSPAAVAAGARRPAVAAARRADRANDTARAARTDDTARADDGTP
ncbi:hypothetical protein [Streptomyces sp. NPDC093094]|uniref:hypothetical protein n=1 Tax=Streptomyces sp. NPDC093094 TaxID=3366026 RepID=UPI003828A517